MNIPASLNTAKTFYIISAILNLLYSIFWLVYVLIVGAFTCGVGCLFFIFPAINITACVMDFIAYNKLNTYTAPGTYGTMQFASIMDIITVMTGNLVSPIFGVIIIINLGQDETRRFLQERNIY